MREWLVDPAGGNVPATNLQLVLSPAPNSPAVDPAFGALDATKSNIVIAINNLMVLSGGKGERLYFYFAGHGLTTRVSNRDESALLATDFTNINTDQSIALRSLWEFFETTQFDDQFLFVDACRNVPPWGDGAEFELGRWTLPRSRDPGMPPVQQFILYATSPKLRAAEVATRPARSTAPSPLALLDGLRGAGPAKAWSWQRQCYEVRWERLADYVKKRVEREARKVGDDTRGRADPDPPGHRQPRGRRPRPRRAPDVVPGGDVPEGAARGPARPGQRLSDRGRQGAQPARRRRRGAGGLHGKPGGLRSVARHLCAAGLGAEDRRRTRHGADRAVRAARPAAEDRAATARSCARAGSGGARRRPRRRRTAAAEVVAASSPSARDGSRSTLPTR